MTVLRLLAVMLAAILPCFAAAASPLVTGNGFGFAVVSPADATVGKFYAHPYSFARPDPADPLSEGVETTNFIKSFAWADGATGTRSAAYRDDSHVIRTRDDTGEGAVYMPFGLRQAALVIDHETDGAVQGRWDVQWSHPVASRRTVRMLGSDMLLLTFDGVAESLLLVPLAEGGRARDPAHVLASSHAWVLVSLESARDLQQAAEDVRRWRAGLAPKALVERELAEVEHWRVTPTVSFASERERHLWRQSEILLRVAQSREPNRPGRYNNGMIVACLPDGSWSMTWVRDMAYAAMAFLRMGHRDEARAALLAWFNARPTGKMKAATAGQDYQVSVVRYFGDGSEEPFFTNEGNTNIEFDDWGLVLWVLGEYLQRYDDPALLQVPTHRGTLYGSARDFVAEPLVANLERHGDGLIVAADTSIWEEHQKDRKHFAFSTAMAIVGLQAFADVARRAGDEQARSRMLADVKRLRTGFDAAFVRDGTLHGTLEAGEKNDIDGALLAVINLGVVADPAVVRSTVERMELLKVVSGGYRRVRSNYTDPSIYEYWYERQEFLFVDFSLAEVHRRLGDDALADAMLRRIVDKAADDHDFIPEMYVAVDCPLFHGAVGDPTGAIPMVGYGAGVYVLHLLQRAEPSGARL
jgi:hypothetical protein